MAVCTYRRPEVLGRLLTQVEVGGAALAAIASVGVVVVDDDPERSAEEVVRRHGGELPVRYLATASGNVSRARNAALDAALPEADLVAFIDDDCWPADGWLAELVSVQVRTGADAVAGACRTGVPASAPAWLTDQPFIEESEVETDAAATERAYLKNLLFRADVLRALELRFDERFGLAGGEDAMFLDSARKQGVTMVHAAKAIVTEQLPPERATYAWQLRRRWWYGNTEGVTSVESGLSSRPRVVAQGIKLAGLAIVRPIRRLGQGRSPQLRFALAELLRGVGRIVGGLGVWLRHH